MTRFQKWHMRRIIRQEVIQGYDHAKKIQAMYGMIREAAVEEFTEDNIVTLYHFLTGLFEQDLESDQ